ncbi:MAG: aldehyde dehydrogenase family protein [Thermoplasmata archaeon]|nr:aldehyde dehydrogenase family protein [Thermoplasmata archaeon]
MIDDGIPADRRADLWVGGARRAPSTGTYRPVIDPSTGLSLGDVAVGSADDARAAVEAAEAVRESWGGTPGHRRAAILYTLATRLRDDRETMARLISREVGKPLADARVEATRAAWVFEFAADTIRHLTGETVPADAYTHPPGNETRLLFTVREPVGVVVAIGPFNFPLNLLSHKIAPALAAGNPVVAKPTSAAPFTALRLASHAAAAGVPAGVLNVVLGPGGAVGDALVEHPATRFITFTGSTEVGKGIAEKAGRHAKRVLLELGGSDPFVVLEDAPLGVVVPAAIRGAFAYSGQVCTASKRLLVHESIADAFAQQFAEAARRLKVGPALEESTQVGPVIDAAAVDRMEALVADARERSAMVLTGGARPAASPGFYYPPTVLDHVPESARVAREEPFGPVVPILRFKDDEEAVRIANGTPYGLQAAVYTNDLKRAFGLARRIRAGGVHLNDPTNLRWDALPFGGVKESGIGREGLRYAMEEMTDVKLISVNYG